ncbi:MAG TPA: oxidoreductase [Lachnoclostridium phytofermentans]|uniref:Oxidoreductase n=1 Tax=Lachnoclostridium phytofermentans TaxID=66219 RepID=A0A3D2X6N6_9FIRM|nr:Gfo/Idh/MocA family oxidoreductase [Lachnoclostridium sp.]HCL02205.1 oxidoreductase [Lachnoclostridium phytofermentans]
MIRIGILGSDNSHALAFSKLANLPDEAGNYLYDDVRVTSIYGLDKERTQVVAREGRIETIVEHPKDMLSYVDAVMVVFRHGNLHYKHALPFIEAGIPTWVDKPFTILPSEAIHLINTAEKYNTLLAGGSTCKYCPDVLSLQQEFHHLHQNRSVISANFNFPGELTSPYGGIYFYGGHAIEIMTTIFGKNPISVKTDVHCGNLIALFKYEDFAVTIHFAEVSEFFATIYSSDKVITHPINISTVYRQGFQKYVDALKKGRMPEDFNSLLRPVLLLEALEKAIDTGGEITIGNLNIE